MIINRQICVVISHAKYPSVKKKDKEEGWVKNLFNSSESSETHTCFRDTVHFVSRVCVLVPAPGYNAKSVARKE